MLTESVATQLTLVTQKMYEKSVALYQVQSLTVEQSKIQSLAQTKKPKTAPRPFIHFKTIPCNRKTPSNIIARLKNENH